MNVKSDFTDSAEVLKPLKRCSVRLEKSLIDASSRIREVCCAMKASDVCCRGDFVSNSWESGGNGGSG